MVIVLHVGLWGSLAWDAMRIALAPVRQLSGLLSMIVLPSVGAMRMLRLHNPGRDGRHHLSRGFQSSSGQVALRRHDCIREAALPEACYNKQVGGSRLGELSGDEPRGVAHGRKRPHRTIHIK